jgi:hypothetical protein
MARNKSYFFIIDNLTSQKALLLKRGLLEISAISDVKLDVHSGLIEVVASKRVGDAVQTACDLAGLMLRTQVKRNELS